MLLFGIRHGVVEQCSLVNVLVELGSVESVLDSSNSLGVLLKTTLLWLGDRESIESVRVIPRSVLLAPHGTLTILLIGHEGTNRSVDRDVAKVDTKTRDLSILVRKVSSGKERIRREVHSWYDVLSTECDLLDLGKVVDRVGIEGKGTNVLYGDEILGDNLGSATLPPVYSPW